MKCKPALILLFALCAVSVLPAQAARKRAVVSTVEQLLKSIAPNMEIVLKPGVYALGEGRRVSSEYVSWDDEDGASGLVLRNVENLVLRGQDTEAASSVQTDDEGAFVISFLSSNGVAIESLNFCHSASGPCQAGVVYLSDCSAFSFKDCLLSGSGSVGLQADDCADLSFSNVAFAECSRSGAVLRGVDGAAFDDCSFRDNGANPLIRANACLGLRFGNCDFTGNWGQSLLEGRVGDPGAGDEREDVAFAGCSFADNEIPIFRTEGPLYRVEGCRFDDNLFPDPETGDDAGMAGEPRYFLHEPSGLGVSYPSGWEMQSEGEMAAFFDSRGAVAIMLAPIGAAEDGNAPFVDAEGDFKRFLETAVHLEVDIQARGMAEGPEYLRHLDFEGTASMDETEAFFRCRVFAIDGRLWSFLLMARASSGDIAPGSEAGDILESADLAPRGE